MFHQKNFYWNSKLLLTKAMHHHFQNAVHNHFIKASTNSIPNTILYQPNPHIQTNGTITSNQSPAFNNHPINIVKFPHLMQQSVLPANILSHPVHSHLPYNPIHLLTERIKRDQFHKDEENRKKEQQYVKLIQDLYSELQHLKHQKTLQQLEPERAFTKCYETQEKDHKFKQISNIIKKKSHKLIKDKSHEVNESNKNDHEHSIQIQSHANDISIHENNQPSLWEVLKVELKQEGIKANVEVEPERIRLLSVQNDKNKTKQQIQDEITQKLHEIQEVCSQYNLHEQKFKAKSQEKSKLISFCEEEEHCESIQIYSYQQNIYQRKNECFNEKKKTNQRQWVRILSPLKQNITMFNKQQIHKDKTSGIKSQVGVKSQVVSHGEMKCLSNSAYSFKVMNGQYFKKIYSSGKGKQQNTPSFGGKGSNISNRVYL